MTAEVAWHLVGGKPWLSPLSAGMYRRLVAAAQPFAVGGQVSVLLANYKTASQLALDCNLPYHKTEAINHGCALGNRLSDLTRVSPANS